MVPGGQGVGLEGSRGSRGRPSGSQGVKRLVYRVPRGQGLGQQVLGGQGVGLQGPRGSRSWPTESQGVIEQKR